MNYPEEFRMKVRQVFPKSRELQRRMEDGDEFVGRLLDDASSETITPEWILATPNAEQIYDRARELKAKRDLYADWSAFYRTAKGLTP